MAVAEKHPVLKNFVPYVNLTSPLGVLRCGMLTTLRVRLFEIFPLKLLFVYQETKFAGEIKALEQFYGVLQSDPDRAVYGPVPVIKANEEQAVETLLITDELFRCGLPTFFRSLSPLFLV